jgi:hypothetical protein
MHIQVIIAILFAQFKILSVAPSLGCLTDTDVLNDETIDKGDDAFVPRSFH